MADCDHSIYHSDTVLLQSYVNKRCTLTARDKSVHTGIVYTVDPVTQSFVLLENANTRDESLKFVMGHAIVKVDVLSEEAEKVQELFQPSSSGLSAVAIAERKADLMDRLRTNHFPVRENGDNIEMEDVFSIKPPYSEKDCVSEQPMVLAALRRAIWKLDNNVKEAPIDLPLM